MNDSLDDRVQLDQLAEEFAQRRRRGETPSLTEYSERFPHLAEEIRELFPALELLEQFKPVMGDMTVDEAGAKPAKSALNLDQLGDYRILREIGRGGMGVVYEAEQLSLGRRVAIKVLPGRTLGDVALGRFLREARAAAGLHHSNIVPVFGVGEDQGLHYYVMQYIVGLGMDLVLEELRLMDGREALARSPTQGLPSGTAWQMAQSLVSGVQTMTPIVPPSSTVRPVAAPEEASATAISNSMSVNTETRNVYWQSVAKIGKQVADALAYAHAQGIVHRDIKPSNLILDDKGTVWVTDFGLAKATASDDHLTHAGDIVGTLRYMAPERFQGKSDIRGDVFSLGITLYEMLTLRPAYQADDRESLLELIRSADPPRPRKIRPSIPRDLETIVLKAIDRDPERRYQTAAELAEDLERFLEDRPILARRTTAREHLWRWCRRNPAVAGLLAAVLVSLIVGTSVASWFAVDADAHARQSKVNEQNALYQKEQADDERKKAQLSEGRAMESLWKAYQDQSRAGRFSGLVGRRFQGLEALQKAAKIRPSLEIRNEAIACMAHADLKIVRQFEGYPAGSKGYGFDANLERYARGDDAGNITIRRLADDQEILRLPGSGVHPVIILFSPDGNFLAVKYHNDDRMYFGVWDLRGPKVVLQVPSGITHTAMAFSADSGRIAYGQSKGGIGLFDLNRGQEEKPLPGPSAYQLVFSPDGSKLAVSVPPQNKQGIVQVREISSGKILGTFPHASKTNGLDWSPDGKSLAVACLNGSIHLWHYPTLKRTAILAGHQLIVTQVNFNHAGDLLVSRSHDGTSRLWNPVTGQLLLSAPGGYIQFSQDDSRLAFINATQVVIWQIAPARECRSLPRHSSFSGSAAISNDGRLLASAGSDGVRFFDLATWKELPGLPIDFTRTALFSPDGKSLITCGKRGVLRWALQANAGKDEHDFRIGPPELLGSLGTTSVEEGGFLSPDGKTLVVFRSAGQSIVFDLDQMRKQFDFDSHLRVAHAAFSPDGLFIATGTWQGKDIKVWKRNSGELVHTLPTPGTAHAMFTPDGKSLITCTADEFQYWEVGTWQPGRRLVRAAAGSMPGTGTFSRDGKLLAVLHSREALHLIHPVNGKPVAILEYPQSRRRAVHCFNPDSSLLVTSDDTGTIQVWDLRLIRSQLKEMSLDWEAAEFAPPTPASALRVQILPGDLKMLMSP